MTPEQLAPLAGISERMLLRDLAALADLREELARAEAEIAQLRGHAAREVAMLKQGASPAEQQAVAKWQLEADRRLRRLIQRKAEIAEEEEAARASALEAFGRDMAVEILTKRAKKDRLIRRRKQAEQDGMPF